MTGLNDYDVPAGDPLEEAEDGTDARIGAFPDPDMTLCPVVPLGFSGGDVWFAMPEGEIRSEKARQIGQMLRTDIFACSAGQAFLTHWRDADDKFQRELAAVWFVRKCRDAGLWDSQRAERSLGVWPGDDGAVMLHLGDVVWRLVKDRKPEPLSIRATMLETRRGPLYRLRPPAPRPVKAATVADGQWARQVLDHWRFDAIGGDGLTGADVAAGWMMGAMLGAVAPFRGHLLVNAMAGSGKTTLVSLMHALMSALAGDVVDSFTEAGLRQEVAGMARPVLLDEAEATPGSNGPGVVERTLEMLRRMATGSGGVRRQGSVGGAAVSQTAVGAVLMAAINPPKLGPADGTRIVEVRLGPLVAEEGKPAATRAELDAVVEKAKGLAPALFGRALKGAWRYRDDVETMSAALARDGCDPRTADLVSMLAAGRRLLLFDGALSPDEADGEVAFWRPLLAQRALAEIVSNPGADCFAYLTRC